VIRPGLAVAAIVFSAFLGGCGVTASSQNPGYADIEVPRGAGLTRDTSISIGPMLLGLASRHANEGPETRALLEAIDGVRVRVYRVEENSRRSWLENSLEDSADRLRDQDWQPVMRVKEADSRVHMLVREDRGQLLGLALISLDDEELVVVNIMGRIEPDMLEDLADTLESTMVASSN
jgi:hypothetical protein